MHDMAWAVPPDEAAPALGQCVAQELPRAVSKVVSTRCGELKLFGIATVRTEGDKTMCVFGPVVSPSEADLLGAVSPLWRSLPFARLVLASAEERSVEAPGAAIAQGRSWHLDEAKAAEDALLASLAFGECVVGRAEADLESDGSNPTGFVSFVGFDAIAASHERAVAGWRLTVRLRVIESRSAETTLSDGERGELDAARAIAVREAQAWLAREIRLPPAYGLDVVAWFEEMDASQCLQCALGEARGADRVAATMAEHARAIGAHGVARLVAERIPVGERSAASLCLHRCWITDASELTAVGTGEHAAQRRFVAELRSAIERDSDCGEKVVKEGGHFLDRLLGALPPGARFDDRIKTIVARELERLCEKDLGAKELHGLAMTIALKAYTAEWVKAVDRYAELKYRTDAWHDALRKALAELIESSALSTNHPVADVQAVIAIALERLEIVLDDDTAYFAAFPPSTDLQRGLLEYIRTHAADAALRSLEPSEASRRFAAHWATYRLLEALYDVTAVQALDAWGSTAYPKPFPFGPQSFRAWGVETRWSVGP
ncbi:MAG: hypothetical protein GC172_10055 [Phycisphaera sp.]|nr:hypothetical protein [Phycisphaera sp.]